VEKLFNSTDDINWRFAIRQLYIAQETFRYEHTTIDLKNDTNKNLNTIMGSPFKPKQWVKNITFNDFTAPKSLKKFNKKTGPLYQLVEHCPNVQKIEQHLEITRTSHFG
jgi:hypothetical protein